jgi:hypothetical protein
MTDSIFSTTGQGTQALNTAARLRALFDGNENGHQIFSGIAQELPTGKYKCFGVDFKDGPPTVGEWERHLAGHSGIGVTAVRKDGTTKFGSIDLDTHGKNACVFSYIEVTHKIEAQKLPLVPIISKSGGLHLFVFFVEPIPASMVRRVLGAWAIALGFPGVEIFPGQDVPSKDGNGSNLWMPYFGCLKKDPSLPQQVGLNVHGGTMDAETLVAHAERCALTFQQFAELAPPVTEEGRSKAKGNGAGDHPRAMSRRQAENYLQEACDEIPKLSPGELNIGVTHWCHLPGRAVGGGLLDGDTWTKRLEPAIRRNSHHDKKMLDRGEASYKAGMNDPLEENIEAVCFDDFRAYMPLHNYIYTPSREHWPGPSVDARLPWPDGVNKDGKAIKIKPSSWLDRHRAVEQMTWAPGLPMLIQDKLIAAGGWIDKPGVTCFNLYRPPTITPGDASKAEPWLKHLRYVFNEPGDAEHIVKWCAHAVQNPEIKINHALVLGSEAHGVGKDAALEPVKHSIGHWNFQEANPQQLMGKFNGFLKCVILRVSEAHDLGETNRYQFYEHIKNMSASPPDTLTVNEKFLREYSIVNCVRLVITTNHLTDGMYLTAEDRRHYVAWSNRTPGDFPDGYWTKLFGWYDAGGDRHVAAYLAEFDLSGFDPKAPPLKTEAFLDYR